MISNSFSAGQNYGSVGMELASRLKASGWEVLTTSAKQGRITRVMDMQATIWRGRHRYAIAQIDIFSGAAFSWAEWSAALLRKLKKSYILTLHGGNLPMFAARHPQRVSKLVCSAFAVTSPSNYLKEKLSPYHHQIQYLPNPLDMSRYIYRLRKNCQPRLIWLRALHQIYNPEMAVQVVAQLKDEFPSIQLSIFGPDKGDGALEKVNQLILDLNLTAHVHVQGAVPKAEVPIVLSQHDIFLNTTTADNTPVSVMEAMASGLCVVSTNVGGLSYLLKDSETALLVNSGDVEAMANAVRRLLKSSRLAQQLSENARMQAETFDWGNILPQWEMLLRAAIEARMS